MYFDKSPAKDEQLSLRVPGATKTAVETIAGQSGVSKNEVYGKFIDRGLAEYQWIQKHRAAVDEFRKQHQVPTDEVMSGILDEWLRLRGTARKK